MLSSLDTREEGNTNVPSVLHALRVNSSNNFATVGNFDILNNASFNENGGLYWFDKDLNDKIENVIFSL